MGSTWLHLALHLIQSNYIHS